MQAQEWCEGEPLGELLRAAAAARGKRLYSYHDTLRWVTQAAKALQFLHDCSPQVLTPPRSQTMQPLCSRLHVLLLAVAHVLANTPVGNRHTSNKESMAMEFHKSDTI